MALDFWTIALSTAHNTGFVPKFHNLECFRGHLFSFVPNSGISYMTYLANTHSDSLWNSPENCLKEEFRAGAGEMVPQVKVLATSTDHLSSILEIHL